MDENEAPACPHDWMPTTGEGGRLLWVCRRCAAETDTLVEPHPALIPVSLPDQPVATHSEETRDVPGCLQPAENSTEWGMDVADIIALREKERRDLRAKLEAAELEIIIMRDTEQTIDVLNRRLEKMRAYLEYVNTHTDISKMSDEQRQLFDAAWGF